MLFCLWYGCYYGELSRSQFDRLLAFAGPWSGQVVQPLRQVRRWLKPQLEQSRPDLDAVAALRDQVKSLELQAEKLQQERLQTILADSKPAGATGPGAAQQNLRRYLAMANISQSGDLHELLNELPEPVADE